MTRFSRRASWAVPAPLLILCAIASVQTGSAVAKTLIPAMGATGVAFGRLLIASLVMLVLLRPNVRGWGRRQWLAVLALGVGLAGMNTLIYLAFQHLSLGVAVTLEYTGPLLVSLLRLRRPLDLVWALMAGAGVAIIGVLAGGHLSFLGVALALGAGGFWAYYILSSARVGRAVSGTDGLVLAMGIAALLAAPFGAVRFVQGAASAPTLIWPILLVALLSSIIPYTLELTALRSVSPGIFGVMSSLNPAAAALTGLLVVREHLGVGELVALVLVSVASAGVALSQRRRVE